MTPGHEGKGRPFQLHLQREKNGLVGGIWAWERVVGVVQTGHVPLGRARVPGNPPQEPSKKRGTLRNSFPRGRSWCRRAAIQGCAAHIASHSPNEPEWMSCGCCTPEREVAVEVIMVMYISVHLYKYNTIFFKLKLTFSS